MFECMQAFIEDKGLKNCIQYNTKVRVVEQIGEGWRLHVSISKLDSTEKTAVINTSELIVAVGLTNQPSMPRYPTSPGFKPIIAHSTGFASQFIVKENTHTLIVIGSKST
ncbi:hypothetical protein P171DRAFT_27283 [Karstenula rhodostoma CBS 690.94]|uniref:L-ornithine N(5)-monooxygenase [NAD(P)H] n=1 Tax=Karstenula rhodostoma CBS 690.94 TaxID=1392251 RepID=A0A9P4PHL4_9PLEO|nr:hypothetical protein P171DRAFT_27283 [Karstenula rhodostoma CBS 690.94]